MTAARALRVAALLAASTARATIEWRDVSASIKSRSILRDISGRATPGRLHAIMGPSGCGKSSLLSALSGTCDRKLSLSGDLRVDGAPVDRVDAAFVRQQDVFYPYLTVRETLTFAATLRLGAGAAVDDVVTDLLTKTGLAKAADTIVGDDKIRGVSGGERKRLAIACELVDDPDVLFLDEPTSVARAVNHHRAQRGTRVFQETSRGDAAAETRMATPRLRRGYSVGDAAAATFGSRAGRASTRSRRSASSPRSARSATRARPWCASSTSPRAPRAPARAVAAAAAPRRFSYHPRRNRGGRSARGGSDRTAVVGASDGSRRSLTRSTI